MNHYACPAQTARLRVASRKLIELTTTMQGFTIKLYENGDIEPPHKTPIGADRIKNWWRATREAAEEKKKEVERKYEGVVEIHRRT